MALDLRRITDNDRVRKLTNENLKKAFGGKTLEGRYTRLKFQDVNIEDKKFSLADQKKALLNNRDLNIKVKGTLILEDKDTGKQLGKKNITLGKLPWRTDRGTYISKGTEYSVANQFRLKYGAYSRVKENGEIETHYNITPGTGRSFRILLDPRGGIFKLVIAQAQPYLYPILKFAGISDVMLTRYWGKEILAANKKMGGPQDVEKVYTKLAGYSKKPGLNTREKAQEILRFFENMKMDASVNGRTMRVPVNKVTMKLLLASTARLLKINREEEEPDDRDSLEYRKLHSAEDFFAERVVKDAGKTGRKLIKRLDKSRNLSRVISGVYSKALSGFITEDDKSATGEQLNPIEILEGTLKTTPLGEGGLSGQNVTESMTNVHPSHFGFLDPIRVPESEKAGLTLYITYGSLKGNDGNLYREVLNTKTNKKHHVSTENFHRYTIAFPGEWKSKKKILKAMKNKKVVHVPRREVQYALLNASDMFTVTTNLVPMLHTAQGNRALMAAKTIPQALPMKEPEEPLVQPKVPGKDESFYDLFGKRTSAAVSTHSGKVTKVTDDYLLVKDRRGDVHRVDIYNNFPYNRKTSIHQTPIVKVGDSVRKGQVVARSNFTDKKGTFSVGKNLRTGYLSYKGYNFEDGVVISESAAKKMTSEHTYSYELQINPAVRTGKKNFVSYFPVTYSYDKISGLDSDGVITKGTIVQRDDPLILAMTERAPTATDISLGKIHKIFKRIYNNSSLVWDHYGKGEVIEVIKGAKFIKVIVKAYKSMEVGDKLTGRHGNKGVIAKILPDGDMPKDKEGDHLEVLLNPQGIISRINPSQIHETLLGKVAKKSGNRVLVKNFHPDDANDFVEGMLKKYKLKDTETMYDPKDMKKLGDVLTGFQYFLKSSATAEKSFKYRGVGPSYTTEEIPAKGMRFGFPLDINALVAHGSRKIIRDAVTRKGQKNDEMWKALRSGEPLPPPKVPHIFEKFISTLKSAGINVKKEGDSFQVMPMTDKETKELSKGEVKKDLFLRAQDYRPEKQGLFDESMTGGVLGKNWTHISLNKPIPNPAVEENIRILLDLTQAKMRDILKGKEKLDGKTGGEAINAALSKMDTINEIKRQKSIALEGRKVARNKAIKKLRVLNGLKNANLKPKDFMINRVPVIPPVFRPITPSVSGPDIIADSNILYKDFMRATNTLKEVEGLGLPEDDEDLQKAKDYQYDSLKKLYGWTKYPSSSTEKNVKGFIHQIIGSSPKLGMFQSKVLKKRQDLTGRAVITPDPKLGIDQAGLPEEMAWELYAPFIMKKMVQRGYTPLQAEKFITDKHEQAKKLLEEEIRQRPILVNRAPTLHKYNIMALYPKLSQEKVLTLPPLIEAGFNADHDGDAMQIHVPISHEAVEEAQEKMLPSKNLYTGQRRRAFWVPQQESIIGLYRATNPKQSKPVMTFNTKEEAIKAYESGKISINDSIEVKNLGA
jgi:DNA-directed RNA polymerase beta subunit